MRWSLLLLAACSQYDPWSPPGHVDASAPDVVPAIEDAGPPVLGTCPGSDAASVGCYTNDTPCGDAGFLYLCSGGFCPKGDVGACTITVADDIGNYSEACCERSACTEVFGVYAPHCARLTDGGRPHAWFCPDGKAPPGKKCAPKEPGSTDLCCED